MCYWVVQIKAWEEEEQDKPIDIDQIRVDPSPFQLVERTSLHKVIRNPIEIPFKILLCWAFLSLISELQIRLLSLKNCQSKTIIISCPLGNTHFLQRKQQSCILRLNLYMYSDSESIWKLKLLKKVDM